MLKFHMQMFPGSNKSSICHNFIFYILADVSICVKLIKIEPLRVHATFDTTIRKEEKTKKDLI